MTGETRTKLEALWGSFSSKWRRLLSRGAITELSLRASFDLDPLPLPKIRNQVPAGLVPDCASCQNTCCAGLENLVSLRLVDIATLIDLGRTDLISKKKPRFPEELLASRPALRELEASALFRALPVMRQVGPHHACAALSPDLRCTLYPHWPLSCERFPYTLSAARRSVLYGTRCQSQRSGPEHKARSQALFSAAVDTFNERIRDAVLIAHAPSELEALGFAAFVTSPDEDPFE